MGRMGEIAVMSAAGGLLMAVAIVSTMRSPSRPPVIVEDFAGEDKDDPLPADLKRCRTITEPDAACAQKWEEQNRRFFNRSDRRP